MSLGTTIAVAAGVIVGAVGAYNFSTTGCVLGMGSCETACSSESAAAVTTVATSGAASECALGCSMESAEVVTVAAESAAEACCGGQGEACCAEGKACCEAMKACCEDEQACCESDTAAVTQVAETTEAAGSCCSMPSKDEAVAKKD